MDKFINIHRTLLINTSSIHRKNILVIKRYPNSNRQSFATRVPTTQTHGKTKRMFYHENQPHLKIGLKHVLTKMYIRKLSLSQVGPNSLATRNLSLGQTENKLACWPKPNYGPMEVFRSQFMNGIRVAAAKPNGGLIAACTIMFRTGSRVEVDDEIGTSHFLRAASILSGCSYSRYIKSRFLQQKGGYITVAADRQTISYTLRCPAPAFFDLKHYLLDTAVRCYYYQHELDQIVKPLLLGELDRRPLQEHCMDLIQQACWAGPLANSVYCIKERIGGMLEDTLRCYVTRLFNPARCAVGSCGVPFEETLKVAEFIDCGDRRLPRPPELCEEMSYPRAGYEAYDYGKGDSYIALAVATDGCTQDLNKLYAYAILVESLGAGHIQQGSHVWDRVTSSPLGALAGCDVHTDYRAFHIAYLDRGMFGIMVKSNSHNARDAARRAVDFFCRIKNISKEQICVGKQRLKLALCIHEDDCTKVSEGLALQIANNHVFDNAIASMNFIDNVDVGDVQCVAQCIHAQTPRMAMAVVGDLEACPDDMELIR